MRTSEAALRLLARQDGLITAAQAREHGLTGRALSRRVSDDGWRRVQPGVVLAGGHAWTDRAQVRAVGLWAGERGAISGPVAAWWLAMLSYAPTRVELTVPRVSGIRSRPFVRVRRRDLEWHDVARSDGIVVTAPPLTTLETAIVVRDGSVFLDRALQRHVSFPAVYQAYCRNMGMPGGSRIAALLIAAANRADSAAERLLISLLRAAGISGWVHGLPFGPWAIDIAFPQVKLAIEVDGWAWHMDVDRFRADRHKGNALTRDGWMLLRFTWHDLTNRPEYVLAEIRAALSVAA